MQKYDVYAYVKAPDGCWYITKNGDFFLHCTGGEEDAKNIVRILNEDCKRLMEEKEHGEKM